MSFVVPELHCRGELGRSHDSCSFALHLSNHTPRTDSDGDVGDAFISTVYPGLSTYVLDLKFEIDS